jgi:hypothetical protein
VQIPAYLRDQYPKEMTIVLQYQYYGLVVSPETFSVTLSFNNVKERLTIPLAAITTFADPSVNFALQFQTVDEEDEEGEEEGLDSLPEPKEEKPEDTGERGVVVSLDQFRKKTAPNDDKKDA